MLSQKATKCLLERCDDDKTLVDMLERMKGIKAELMRASGVLRSITPDRINRKSSYWLKTIHGWANRINILANELIIIESAIASHLSQ